MSSEASEKSNCRFTDVISVFLPRCHCSVPGRLERGHRRAASVERFTEGVEHHAFLETRVQGIRAALETRGAANREDLFN
ncbi:hypothetical protein PPSIR1_38651 [Plesiocystis pacifica SIR-1]|uniref:Uncharacterized protein n=1 Tax=Plesiocystis pacifica SIR-1 TaxID=391625 RepID=A6G8Q3_9BACT|nr:hypothetical protein PPSIR1_38651 [Plesiocystis pacifica SIR-1]